MDLLNNAMFDLAAKALVPIVVGIVTPYIVDALKRASAWLDAAPVYVKQGVAVAFAGAATMLSTALEMGLPSDPAQWNAAVIKTVVAALLGIAIKQQKQLRSKKA